VALKCRFNRIGSLSTGHLQLQTGKIFATVSIAIREASPLPIGGILYVCIPNANKCRQCFYDPYGWELGMDKTTFMGKMICCRLFVGMERDILIPLVKE